MYIHIGGNTMIDSERIIGLFDMEKTTVSARTRPLLARMQREGRVTAVSGDLPRTMILAYAPGFDRTKRGGTVLYTTPVSSATIAKRI